MAAASRGRGSGGVGPSARPGEASRRGPAKISGAECYGAVIAEGHEHRCVAGPATVAVGPCEPQAVPEETHGVRTAGGVLEPARLRPGRYKQHPVAVNNEPVDERWG